MKILVVGANGSIGRKHLKILKQLGHKVDGIDIEDNYIRILEKSYEAVYICTPTNLHVSQVKSALDKKIPVFCEKPLGCSWEGIDELVSSTTIPNHVSCNLRFMPSLQKFRKEVCELKKPLNILQVFGYNLNKWRKSNWKGYSQKKEEGGGIILEAIHELDYLYDMFGLPKGVSAFTEHIPLKGIEHGVDTAATIFSRFFLGSIATTHLNSLNQTYLRFCIVSNGDRELRWDFNWNEWEKSFVDQDKYFLEAVSKGTQTFNSFASHAEILKIALYAISIGRNTGSFE